MRVGGEAASPPARRRRAAPRACMYRSCSRSPSSPSQTRAESMSDEGTTSRRPRLPSASQATGQGGAPSSPTVNSISRRVRASATTAMIEAICAGELGIVKGDHRRTQLGRTRGAAVEVVGVVDRAPQRERRSGFGRQQVSVAEDPEDLAVGPDHRHVPDVAVEHLEHDLVAKRSGVTVNAGALITSVTGASASTPPATTRSRRSMSVTIPRLPSGRRTRAALASPRPCGAAASRTASLGSQMIGRLCTSRATGCCAGSRSPSAPPRRATGERAGCAPRSARPAGRASSGTTGVGGQPIAERVLASPGLESGRVAPRASRDARRAHPHPGRRAPGRDPRSSTAPRRTMRTCSIGPSCWRKIVAPAAKNSTSADLASSSSSVLGEVVERSVPPQELDYVVHRGCAEVCLICPVGTAPWTEPCGFHAGSGDRRVRASRPRSSSGRHARPRGGDRADLQAGDRGAGCDIPDAAPTASRDRSGDLRRKARNGRGGRRPRGRLGEVAAYDEAHEYYAGVGEATLYVARRHGGAPGRR